MSYLLESIKTVGNTNSNKKSLLSKLKSLFNSLYEQGIIVEHNIFAECVDLLRSEGYWPSRDIVAKAVKHFQTSAEIWLTYFDDFSANEVDDLIEAVEKSFLVTFPD